MKNQVRSVRPLPEQVLVIVQTTKGQVPFLGEMEQASMHWVEMRHFESIRQWIYDHTGLYCPERKHALLYQRLKKLCWRLGILYE